MKSFIFSTVFFFLSVSAFSQQQWMNYTSGNSPKSVLIDDGFAFFCTEGGLIKTDLATEQRTLILPYNSPIHGVDVEKMIKDGSGGYWIAGNEAGLHHWDGADAWEHYYSLPTGDTIMKIQELSIDDSGVLWFSALLKKSIRCHSCAFNGIFSFDGQNFVEHAETLTDLLGLTGPHRYNTNRILIDSSGLFWNKSGDVFFAYDGDTIVKQVDLNNQPIGPNSHYFFEVNNEIYAATHNSQVPFSKLWVLQDTFFVEIPLPTEVDDMIFAETHFSASDSSIWLQYHRNDTFKVLQFKDENWTIYDDFSSNVTLSSYRFPEFWAVDEDGGFWFWTFEYGGTGIQKYENNTWKKYNSEIQPFRGHSFSGIATDCNNDVWIGGNQVYKFDGLDWTEIKPFELGIDTPIMDYYSIEDIFLDTSSCDMWLSLNLGTDSVAIIQYNQDTVQIPLDNGADNGVFKTLVGPDGIVWAAVYNRGLGRYDGSEWHWFYTPIPNSWYNAVRDIAMESSGAVWSARGNGIYRAEGMNEVKIPIPGNQQCFGVWIDRQGQVFAQNDEFRRYLGGSWEVVPTPYPLDMVRDMKQDVNGDYWIGTDFGLYKWDGVNSMHFYGVENSAMGAAIVRNIHIDNFGNKWIAHIYDGISVFNENGLSSSLLSPPNQVSGKVYFDANQNQTYEPTSESGIRGEKIRLMPENRITLSDYTGKYTFFPDSGNHENIFVENQSIYAASSNPNIPYIVNSSDVFGLNFGLWRDMPSDSIVLDMTAGLARCHSTMSVWLNLDSYGSQIADGTLTLTFDTALTYSTSLIPPLQLLGNTITWSFSDLGMLDRQSFQVFFDVGIPSFIGQTITLDATAEVEVNGQIVASSSDSLTTEIRCSYDPNEKASEAVGPSDGPYSLLENPIDYTIYFQNTGNDTAFLVVLKDVLSEHLDIESFEFIASSHPCRTEIRGQELTFTFNPIALLWEKVDYLGSQGFVKFRIAPKAGLASDTEIENTAAIYFDFNPPIITNTTSNVLVEELSSSVEVVQELKSDWILYPNPNTGRFFLKNDLGSVDFSTVSVQVFDQTGRLVQSRIQDASPIFIEKSGVYHVLIEVNGQRWHKKIVVVNP